MEKVKLEARQRKSRRNALREKVAAVRLMKQVRANAALWCFWRAVLR
jgi:hypothetical protein